MASTHEAIGEYNVREAAVASGFEGSSQTPTLLTYETLPDPATGQYLNLKLMLIGAQRLRVERMAPAQEGPHGDFENLSANFDVFDSATFGLRLTERGVLTGFRRLSNAEAEITHTGEARANGRVYIVGWDIEDPGKPQVASLSLVRTKGHGESVLLAGMARLEAFQILNLPPVIDPVASLRLLVEGSYKKPDGEIVNRSAAGFAANPFISASPG